MTLSVLQSDVSRGIRRVLDNINIPFESSATFAEVIYQETCKENIGCSG